MLVVAVVILFGAAPLRAGESIRIATWNVENYLIQNRVVDGTWLPDYPKPESEKAALRQVIRRIDADVIALQEMGTEDFLRELQTDLAAEGLDYPFRATGAGQDSVRRVAVLSRLPIHSVTIHTDLDFPYFGDRLQPRRALLEIELHIADATLRLFVVHLKSKWTERDDDPQANRRRIGEATAIRNRILELIDPQTGYYLILGDFNDSPRSSTLARFLQRGEQIISLMTHPTDSRGHRWTQHWEREDLYSRIDYILVSPALMPMLVEESLLITDCADVAAASDHRPLVAAFALAQPHLKSASTDEP